MAEYKRIVIVNVREDGQPDKLVSLGDNDNISDEVLSDSVREAAVAVPGLKTATGTLNNQVTNLEAATGTLKAEIDAIEGVSITGVEQDVQLALQGTGTNFNSVTGINQATGVLQTDLDVALQGTGTNFHSVTGIYQATGNLTNSGNFPVNQLNNNLDANDKNIIGIVDLKGRDSGAFKVSGNATTITSKGGPISLVYGTELQYVPEAGGPARSIPGQFTTALDGTGSNFHSVTGINQATGTLQADLDVALQGTGTNFHSVTGINQATGVLQTDLDVALQGTGTNFHSVTGIYQATGELTNSGNFPVTQLNNNLDANSKNIQGVVNIKGRDSGALGLSGRATTITSKGGALKLVYGTNLQYESEAGGATLSIPDQFTTALQGTGTNFDNVTGIYQATGDLQSQINAIDGVSNPLTEDLDLAGFRILNATGIDSRPLGFELKSDNINIDSGWGQSSQAATGTITFIADDLLLKPNPAGDSSFIIPLGKGLLVTDNSGVGVSGDDGTTVDPPPDGAALVLDTTQAKLKYQKIKGINIADGAVGTTQLATGAVGDNELGTGISIDSHASLGSISLNKIVGVGPQTIMGNSEASLNGPMEALSKSAARNILGVSAGTAAPPSPDAGDLWYNTTDDELYTYDSGRGHWLGCPYYISFGKSVSTGPGVGHFLYVGHQGTTATSSERGWLVPHDMVITGWRGHTQSTFTDWTFRVDKNSGGTNTTGIVSTGTLGAVDTFSDFTTDVDVAAGDILGVAGVLGTSTINNSTVTVKIQRKGA